MKGGGQEHSSVWACAYAMATLALGFHSILADAYLCRECETIKTETVKDV